MPGAVQDQRANRKQPVRIIRHLNNLKINSNTFINFLLFFIYDK